MAYEKKYVEFRIKVATKDNDYITYIIKSATKKLEDIALILNDECYDFLLIENYCFNKKNIIMIEQV